MPVVCDLEREDPTPHARGADAIVFAAGAGPGSGPERKQTVDLGAAVKCVEAAKAAGVARFVIVSSIGAQDPDAGPEAMRPYLRAKADADAAVAASGLDWTVVRPGSLDDDPGTGLRRPSRPRSAVAAPCRATTSRSCCSRRCRPPPPSVSPSRSSPGTSPPREAVRKLQPPDPVTSS